MGYPRHVLHGKFVVPHFFLWVQFMRVDGNYMFTYPVAVLVGVFVSQAVAEKPSKYPTLHVMAVLPWVAAGFYGPLGYPIFLFPYIVTLLIARMRSWATVAGISMLLNGVLYPVHSPLISLSLPIVVSSATAGLQTSITYTV